MDRADQDRNKGDLPEPEITLIDDDKEENIARGRFDRRNSFNDQFYTGAERRKGSRDRRALYNEQLYTGPERRRLREKFGRKELEDMRADSIYYEGSGNSRVENNGEPGPGGLFDRRNPYNDQFYSGPDRRHEREILSREEINRLRADSVQYEGARGGSPVRQSGKEEELLYDRILDSVSKRGLNYGEEVISEVGIRRVDVDHSAVSVSLGESRRPITDPLSERLGDEISDDAAGNAFSFDLAKNRARKPGVGYKGRVVSKEKAPDRDNKNGSGIDYSI